MKQCDTDTSKHYQKWVYLVWFWWIFHKRGRRGFLFSVCCCSFSLFKPKS